MYSVSGGRILLKRGALPSLNVDCSFLLPRYDAFQESQSFPGGIPVSQFLESGMKTDLTVDDLKDFSNVLCRICITKKDDDHLIDIFDPMIMMKFEECTKLKIQANDGLPTKICGNCENKLNVAFDFKKLCLETHSLFKKLLENVDEECSKDIQHEENYVDNETSRRNTNNITGEHQILPTTFIDCGSYEMTYSKDFAQSTNDNHIKLENETPTDILIEKFQCSDCNKTFQDVKKFKRHITFHREKTYKCENCEKAFHTQGELVIHKRIHSGEKPFECSICCKTFIDQRVLKRHLQIHTGEKNYQCKVCDKAFTHSSTLQAHLRLHSGERPFVCETCGKSYKYAHNLYIHSRIHTGDRPYSCTKCSKTFRSISTRKAHMLTHRNEKRFTCNICGKKVSRSGDLTIHKRVHTNERPYECSVCSKSYKMASHLKAHMISHTGEKNFSCELCDEKFAANRFLQDHINKHNGIKAYQCDVCGQNFAYNTSLFKHRKKHLDVDTDGLD